MLVGAEQGTQGALAIRATKGMGALAVAVAGQQGIFTFVVFTILAAATTGGQVVPVAPGILVLETLARQVIPGALVTPGLLQQQ